MTIDWDVSAWPVLPLSPEDDAEVEREVAKQLGEFDEENVVYHQDMPGMGKMSGQEALLFFELQTPLYWYELWSTHPNEARDLFRQWARLAQKYRGAVV